MKVLLIPQILLIMVVLVSCQQQSGEIKFQTIALEGFEKHPKGTAENDGLSYKINFQYPSKYADKAVLEKLQTQFIRFTLGEDYAQSVSEAELKKAVEAYIAVWKKIYYDNMKEMQDLNSDPDFVIGWHVECSNAILFMNDALLQLQTKDGLYPYAAHVFESVSYHLFNLQTGDEYRRDDVFKSESAENISRLIIPELLKYWNVRSEREVMLQRNKIWTQETNFALTAEGVLITYNDNELTDYMPGMPSLTIPYETIMPYLREGTPVWDVANNTARTTHQAPVSDVEEPLANNQQSPAMDDAQFSELLQEIIYKLPESIMPEYLETEEQRREMITNYIESGETNLTVITHFRHYDEGYDQWTMAGYLTEDQQNVLLIVQFGSGLDGFLLKSDKTLNYSIETQEFTEIERPIELPAVDEIILESIFGTDRLFQSAKTHFNSKMEFNYGNFYKEGFTVIPNYFYFWDNNSDFDYYGAPYMLAWYKWDGKQFYKYKILNNNDFINEFLSAN